MQENFGDNRRGRIKMDHVQKSSYKCPLIPISMEEAQRVLVTLYPTRKKEEFEPKPQPDEGHLENGVALILKHEFAYFGKEPDYTTFVVANVNNEYYLITEIFAKAYIAPWGSIQYVTLEIIDKSKVK